MAGLQQIKVEQLTFNAVTILYTVPNLLTTMYGPLHFGTTLGQTCFCFVFSLKYTKSPGLNG